MAELDNVEDWYDYLWESMEEDILEPPFENEIPIPATWDLRPFDNLDQVGVLDPEGLRMNPFNGQPYSEKYRKAFDNKKHWKNFPVNEKEAQRKTFTAIQENQIILLRSGTGSGKSSQVPKFLSHLLGYRGRIAITIPTQISAIKNATFMAEAMDVELGEEIGYKFRGTNITNKKGKKTNIFFTTDGSIVAQLLGNDPDLLSLNALVIDEVHKRSSNIDLLLLLIKSLVQRRSDFKLILVSATIDIELFRKYYPAPTFRFTAVDISSGPMHSIKEHWLEKPIPFKAASYIQEAVKRVNSILRETKEGDILVFLATNTELTKACELLNETNKDNLSFCMTASSATLSGSQEQMKLIIDYQKDNPKRKVIMSTNVAEESITINNVDFVIDTGVALKNVYNATKMVNVMDLVNITKASVKQRIGRTGREKEGTAYHLYTKEQYNVFPDYDIPQIKSIDLAHEFLKILNMPFIQSYKKAIAFLNDLIEPPEPAFIVAAIRQLEALGCFTKGISGGKGFNPDLEDLGDITLVGKIMSHMAFKPRIAKSLLMANYYGVRTEAMFMYTLLELASGKLSNLFMMKRGDKKALEALEPLLHSKGDYLTVLHVYNEYETYYRKQLPPEDAVLTKEEKEKAVQLAKQKTFTWARQHYLNSKLLDKVKNAYMTNMRNFRDLVAPEGKENVELKEILAKEAKGDFKTRERLLIQAVLEGEGVVQTAIQERGLLYNTTFPPEKTTASIGQDTLLPKGTKFKSNIVYNSLLILNGSPSFGPILFV